MKNKKILNKKADLSITQLVSLILVLVVIIFVLIAIFNPVVWAWVRQLPDYKYDNSDKEISNFETDAKIREQYFPVAKVINAKDINFCIDENCDNLVESKLYIKGDDSKGKIMVKQGWDDQIGNITGGRIKIYNEIINKKGDLYDEVKGDLSDYNYINNLDGGLYVSGIIYQAKKNQRLKVQAKTK